MTARSILTISYGLEIGWSDPISDIAEAFCTAAFEAAVMPVTVLMDAIPLLQYLPSWMPGILVLFVFFHSYLAFRWGFQAQVTAVDQGLV